MRKGFIICLALILSSCSTLPEALRSNQALSDQSMPSQEILIPVTRGTISTSLSFVGNLQYSQSAQLNWKTSGVIDSVNVKTGDRVRKGDILAVLAADSLSPSMILSEKTLIEQQENLEDVLDSKSAQMEAYVTLNAKESALKKAKLEQEALYYPRATRQDMELAWDSLALANLNFNYAKQDYDYLVSINEPWEGFEEDRVISFFGRTFKIGGDSRSGRERKFEEYVSTYNTLVSAYEKYLWTTGEPSAIDYAVAEGNVQVAQKEYDKALEDYLSYESTPREKDVHAAEVSLNNAETAYNQRFIIAQFDGTVTSVDAVAGYYVSQGAAAIRLDDMNRIFIPVSIPELDVSSVSKGTAVNITVDAISGKTFSGHIYEMADASSSSGSTNSFSAVVEIDDPDPQMRAGMTAEISIPMPGKSNAYLIPNTAISYTDGKTYVTVKTEEEQQTVEVQLGIITDSIAEVTSGNLREGALLAVNNITADALTQLGLDASQYFPGFSDMPQMPQNQQPSRGTDRQRNQETVNSPASVPTDMPDKTSTPVPTVSQSLEKPDREDKTVIPSQSPLTEISEGLLIGPPGNGSSKGTPMPQFGENGGFNRENDGQKPARPGNREGQQSPGGQSFPDSINDAAPTPAPTAAPAVLPSEKG